MPRKKRPETPPDPKEPILPGVNPAAKDHLRPDEGLEFPIVAIGASAGGLEATSLLLGELPRGTGMAFVIVQHLSPNHESMLSEILTRNATVPVTQVVDNTLVEPDHAYVIPPGKDMVYSRRALRLEPRMELRGQARPIDRFMRSLAEEHGHRSIGVVLSGTANDGSMGIQEIKAASGITFAQDDTAEQSSMPRSAIATGAVDFVLPPREIARELGRIAHHPYVRPAPGEANPALNEAAMQRVLGMLRHHMGVDFDGYKRNTIDRRVTRRMVLHKLDGLTDYVRFLQANPAEVEALFQDLLITVTSFFRNPEAYEALKAHVFPKLTEERSRHDPVRVWALGCSTGEEAYSIAMAFTEYVESTGRHVNAQIFATDLNGAGVEKARAGIYGKGIAQDVSAERLRRFFVEVDGTYRIAKPIRDMCVFARQNALADPPFSRLDVVACRNMLIYLDTALQQRLIPTMHYALRNTGFLWLGGSETIGSYRDLFEPVDAKHKIFAKKAATLAIPIPKARFEAHPEGARASRLAPREPAGPDSQREADRLLLARYSPAAVVVSADLEILQFRGDTSPYLMPAPGRASLNLIKMLREGLMVGVRGAITRAQRDEVPVREDGLRVRGNGGLRQVDVEVVPLRGNGDGGGFVVVFEEPAAQLRSRARQLQARAQTDSDHAARNRAGTEQKELELMRSELASTREYLQSVIEQQEASNEELQSSNEEVQSANEELQSINEELETSKEEIQSANEELATVNDELQNRNLELSRSNNDLTNLLGSVQMPIVMIGSDLRIRRFTPGAEKLFNLIPGDVGRPISEARFNLEAPELEAMVIEVIETVSTREREVQDRSGRWYLLRVRPYRTLENKIEGAVIVTLDVDAMKRGEQALRESEARFEVLANTAPVMIWMSDLEGVRFVNRAFEDFVGHVETEIRQSNISRFVHPEERAAFEEGYREAVAAHRPFESRARFHRTDGEYRWMKTVATPRFHSDGRLVGYVAGTFDITDMKEAEAALLELDRGKDEFLAMLAHELRNPLAGVRNATELLARASGPGIIAQAREIIERQTGNMVRMIDDLLDVSRITQRKIQLRVEDLDLAELLRRCVESTAHEWQAGDRSLTVTLPDKPVWVRGDPLRLEQVVANLLNNAAKFTRPGGRIWLSLETDRAAGHGPSAVIRVRDNGVGIEPELLPRIFDVFVQAEESVGRTSPGIGLGLTLAKRLVELHDGAIEAFSGGAAMGSEFVVRLPAREADAKPNAPAPAPTARRKSIAPRRILIVDDNVDSAESMRLLFRMAGHEVRVLGEGAKAADMALQFRPDAVLLDIGLPDMDGHAVARAMRKIPELDRTLVVAVTGYGREEDVRKSRDAGIDEHMTKPIDADRLFDLIATGRGAPGDRAD
jgi:two-component system CheB/CheR fusion protein